MACIDITTTPRPEDRPVALRWLRRRLEWERTLSALRGEPTELGRRRPAPVRRAA